MLELIVWAFFAFGLFGVLRKTMQVLRKVRTRRVDALRLDVHGDRGAQICLLLFAGFHALALYVTCPPVVPFLLIPSARLDATYVSSWHLLWATPAAFIASSVIASIVATARRRTTVDSTAVVGGLAVGLVGILSTWLQALAWNKSTGWVMFRMGVIPIPLILVTALASVAGCAWFLQGFFDWKWPGKRFTLLDALSPT